MQKFIIIGAFVGLVCLLTSTRADQYFCPEGEVIDCCKNPCEPTCQQPDRTPCPTFACQRGCVCRPGTIRDEISGKCVRPRDCQVCPINEVPNDCRDVCEPTCQNQNEFQCIFQNKRCVCKPGFLRDHNSGKCVSPNCCPRECGRNEEWNECTKPACRRTCQSFFRKDFLCRQVCVPGCECIKGYIWDEYCQKCVPENQCPNVCGINEEWKNCSDIRCRKTCQDPTLKPCPKICVPGCSCREGFIWDDGVNQCVPTNECSKYCDENQEWRECTDLNCRETCQKPHPKFCTMQCISGCTCKDGYIWDEYYKKCVRRGKCSKVCDTNAEWHEFLPPSIPSCQTLTLPQSGLYLPFFPIKPGCMCKRGFIWDELSQKCVRPQDCPGVTTTAIRTTTTAIPTTTTAPPTTTTAPPTTTTAPPTTTTAPPTTTTAIPTTTTAIPTTTTAPPTTTTAPPTTTTAPPTTTTAIPTTTTAIPTTTTAPPTTTTAIPTTTTAIPTTTTAPPTTTTAPPTTTTAPPTTTTAIPTTTTAIPTTTTAPPTTTTAIPTTTTATPTSTTAIPTTTTAIVTSPNGTVT